MNRPRFSIITCCYNSARRLDSLEASLQALDLEGCGGVEFIFVDNRSSDETGDKLAGLAQRLPAPARVLVEPNPGLMFARRAAVACALGDWLVFFDDDNEPRKPFIRHLADLLNRYPRAVIFTGNAVLPPEYQLEAQWQEFLAWLAVRKIPGEFAYSLDRTVCPHYPFGAGMVIRREPMADACEQWHATARSIVGRQGNTPSGGEDIWMAHYVTRNREEVVFSDRLEVVHRIDRDRFTLDYARRLGFQLGLDFIKTDQMVRTIKPWVKDKSYAGKLGLLRAFAETAIHGAAFLLRPTAFRMARFAAKTGLAQDLMVRLISAASPAPTSK